MASPRPSNPNIRYGWPTFNRRPSGPHLNISAPVRLAHVYGVAHGKNAMELFRRSCRRVAEGNTVLRSCGMLPLVIEQNAQIEASLASDVSLSLTDALHLAEVADCLEQLPDETFREDLRQGKASIAEAKEYVRKSAAARHKAEQAERAVLEWIKEQGEK